MKKYIKYAIFALVLFFGVDIGRYFVYPDVGDLVKTNPITTEFMEYRKVQWADEGRAKEINQKWVNFEAISPYLVKAALISEDDGF